MFLPAHFRHRAVPLRSGCLPSSLNSAKCPRTLALSDEVRGPFHNQSSPSRSSTHSPSATRLAARTREEIKAGLGEVTA